MYEGDSVRHVGGYGERDLEAITRLGGRIHDSRIVSAIENDHNGRRARCTEGLQNDEIKSTERVWMKATPFKN